MVVENQPNMVHHYIIIFEVVIILDVILIIFDVLLWSYNYFTPEPSMPIMLELKIL